MPKGVGEWMRGRAASPFRTSERVRDLLLEHGAMGISQIHRELKREIRERNFEMAQRGSRKRYRSPHYQSFLVHLHMLERAGLVEFSHEEEMEFDPRTANLFLRGRSGEAGPPRRRYYRLTAFGASAESGDAWINPRKLI